LLAVEGQQVQTVAELLTRVSALKPGQPAHMTVLRQSDQIEVTVTPGQRPKAKSAPH
jgi:S1-C subfamily serine protease